MLEGLGKTLRGIINKISGSIFVDRKLIAEISKELRYSMLESDVDAKLIAEIIEKIDKLAEKSIQGVDKKTQLIKLLNDEIVKLVGEKKYELMFDKGKLNKIVFVGLYGSGKTTTIAKLALYYSKRGYKVCMLGLDVHRPAAPEQLEQLGKKINLPVFIDKQEKNPVKIWEKFLSHVQRYDLCLIDTAGRDVLNAELIEEIKTLYEKIQPKYTILVMPADIGQIARKQANGFKKACNISGVIVTRMDGTAKGGGALAACHETSSPVYFIGTGEHITDIETFSPDKFISRLLGMGDLQALIEKARTAEVPKKKITGDKFNLIDFYDEIKAIQNVGPLGKIAELIPGISAAKDKMSGMLDIQTEKIKKWKYVVDSMTLEEIENPEILDAKRIGRIAKGSGVTASDIREMLSQYNLIKDFMGKKEKLAALEEGRISPSSISQLGLSQKKLRKLAKKFKI